MKYRLIIIALATATIFTFWEAGEACTCARGRTIKDDIASSRAIFSGKVLYTNRAFKWKWLRVKYQLYGWAGIEPPEFVPRNYSTQVTFEVFNSWKGLQDDVVTYVTGFGGGDCGVPFEPGEEYLVFVSNYDDWWYDISICSRTELLKYAASDIATLGRPVKLKHKSVAFHVAKNNLLMLILFAVLSSGLFVIVKYRKKRVFERK
jgi:hypothetical protein